MAEAEDARALCKGSYSAWMKKVKSDGAKAKWISSMTKRYFTIDFDSQIFFYSHSEDQKKVSQPIRFKEIVGAERLPPKKKLRKGSHDCGFVLRTTERTFELYTTSNTDAVQWVHALNAARDILAKDEKESVTAVAAADSGSPPGSSPKSGGSPKGSPKAELVPAPLGSVETLPRADDETGAAEAGIENGAGDEDVITHSALAGSSSAAAATASTSEEGCHSARDCATGSAKAATPEATAEETTVAKAQPVLQERPRAPKVLPALSLRPGPASTPGPSSEQCGSDQTQQEAKLLVTRPGARRSADLENQASTPLQTPGRDAKLTSAVETLCVEEAVEEPQHVSTPLSKLTGEHRSPFTDASSPAAPAAAAAESTGATCRGLEKTPAVGLARSVAAQARTAAECSAAAQTPDASTTAGPCDLSAASLEYSACSGSLRDSQKDDKGVLLLPSEEDTEESSAVASTAAGSVTPVGAGVALPQSARAHQAAAADSSAVAAGEEGAKKAADEKTGAEAAAKKASEEKGAVETAERKTAEEKVEDEAAARKAAQDKTAAEAAERKTAEHKPEVGAVARKAADEKAIAEVVERKTAEEKANAETAAQKAAEEKAIAEAAERKIAEERAKDDAVAKKAAEEKAAAKSVEQRTIEQKAEAEANAKEATEAAEKKAVEKAEAEVVAKRAAEEKAAIGAAESKPAEEKVAAQNAEYEASSQTAVNEPSGWDSDEEAKAPVERKDESAGWDSEEETEAATAPPAGTPQVHVPAEDKNSDRFKQEMKDVFEEEEQHEEPSGWDSDHENEVQPANATTAKDSPLSPSGWDDSDEDSSDDDEATPLKDAACGAPQQPVQDFTKAKPAIGEVDELVGMVLAADANTPYKMGSTGGSYGFVPNLQCTGCDSQVLRVEKKVWNKDANYMFFRNNYPNVMKLRKNLEPKQSCCAYCCQCSWKSAEAEAVLEDVCQGLRWRLVST